MAANKPQPTQLARIKSKLEKAGSITQADAVRMGIQSLSSRISELRRQGHPISNKPYMRGGREHVRYVLAG